ncbi:putative transcription factor GRF family [Arabidopsis thaliana]
MSSNFDNSIASTQSVSRWGRGLPSKCNCGLDVVIYTSTSGRNPGRPYFRCPTRKDDHLFKCVEDGTYEVVVDSWPKLSGFDSELSAAKSEVSVELEALQAMVKELKEEVMRSERENQKWKLMIKLCCFCLAFIIIVIVFGILMFPKINEQRLFLGY